MPPATPPGDAPSAPGPGAAPLEALEARVARIEAYLQLNEAPAAAEAEAAPPAGKAEDDLEYRIGQEWFARVGVAALGIGVAVTLALPYPSLPPAAPSLLGYLLAAGLLAAARFCPRPLEQVAGPLRAVAMALFSFASLRLCYLGDRHALAADSAAGGLVLALTAGINLAAALRRGSAWLTGLALFTGFACALAVGTPAFGLALVGLFALAAVGAGLRLGTSAPVLVAMPLAYAAYASWALNDPVVGRPLQAAAGPAWAPAVLLVCMVAFSAGLLRLTRGDREQMAPNAGLVLNPLVAYAIFLAHTLASFEPRMAAYQAAAAAVLLALALLHARERDAVGSFVCAMTGFAALSLGIIKATEPPDVFVWLSVQSVVVVATAIGLRSRFIVVANFAIYLGILACYVATDHAERGVSIGFGVVALLTARLLGWKQGRLELKTGLMRNAYLIAAFFIFPYALYHLVPGAWVALAWVGAALLYYLLSAVLHNPKYRWMAHATLLLTAVYLAVAGLRHLDPVLRTVSFLVLGGVLLAVSLVFTRLRARR